MLFGLLPLSSINKVSNIYFCIIHLFATFDSPEVMEESIVTGNGRNEASEGMRCYQIRK